MDVIWSKSARRGIFFIIITFIVAIIIGILSAIFINNIIAKEQIRHELAIVGKLTHNGDVNELSILSGEINEEDYRQGKQLLSNYSYGTNISSIYKRFSSLFYSNIIVIIVVLVLSYILVITIFINSHTRTYKQIQMITHKLQSEDLSRMNEFENNDNSELGILRSTLNMLMERSNHRISSLDKDKILSQKMLTDISHQLKTPLSTIRMYNEIMLTKPDISKEHKQDFLMQSKDQIDKIDWLVQGLLKMARLEGNAIKMIKAECSLTDTIDSALSSLYHLAIRKDVKIVLESTMDAIVSHDSQWVAQAISNIVKNAIEHSTSGGVVEITIEETPLTAEIRIKDNGVGIKKEDLPNVFKRFYHARGVKSNSVGIGLELAKEILSKNNAEIYVQSEYSKGAEFIITFLKKS